MKKQRNANKKKEHTTVDIIFLTVVHVTLFPTSPRVLVRMLEI